MRIAVVTSGGDAPGMNAAVRAVVRSAAARGWETWGVPRGFEGLIAGELRPLGPREVGGVLHEGGTLLGSARSPAFKTPAGRRRAAAALARRGAHALIVIGGNGSQSGAAALHREGVRVLGVASTIDNDLPGSEPTIGADSALNVAVEAIDRLKTTASSLRRVFLVEVMGRDHGWLALMAGLAGGAEAVLLPGETPDPARLAAELRAASARGKPHAIVVVAEGVKGGATGLARSLSRASLGFEARVTILGHVQRGGPPTAFDRVLATRLGAAAVERLAAGRAGELAGWLHGEVAFTSLAEVADAVKPLPRLLPLARAMAL